MDAGGFQWSIIDIVAPLILLVVLIWAALRNRKNKDTTIERSERGARELREELNEEDRRRG